MLQRNVMEEILLERKNFWKNKKKGKKRMKQVGNVEIPQEAFLAALKMDVGGN